MRGVLTIASKIRTGTGYFFCPFVLFPTSMPRYSTAAMHTTRYDTVTFKAVLYADTQQERPNCSCSQIISYYTCVKLYLVYDSRKMVSPPEEQNLLPYHVLRTYLAAGQRSHDYYLLIFCVKGL